MLIFTAYKARSSQGFSLIELMIAVVILAILMGLALPAYQQQSLRGNRAAAQAEMLKLAGLQQQFLLSNHHYMDEAALAAAGYVPDAQVARHYQASLSLGNGKIPTYILRFTPTAQQRDDGWLELDSRGHYRSEFANRWWR